MHGLGVFNAECRSQRCVMQRVQEIQNTWRAVVSWKIYSIHTLQESGVHNTQNSGVKCVGCTVCRGQDCVMGSVQECVMLRV